MSLFVYILFHFMLILLIKNWNTLLSLNRIKQKLLIVYSYEFICVYIISFYANITKIGILSYHCRFTQSKPDKEYHVAV